MRKNLWLFLLVAVVAGGAGLLTGQLLKEDPNDGPAAEGPGSLLGATRPPFTLGASDGQRISVDAFDGQVLLINFWATWCTPCRKEMPMLNELHQEFADQGLAVVGIALDDVARARAFAEDLGIEYTILVGAGDVMATNMAYGNQAGVLPYTVLVDRNGKVAWTYLGELTHEALLDQLKPLL